MDQAEQELPRYLHGVRPIEGRLLALLELDDIYCDRGRGRPIHPDEEAELDLEVARVRREIIRARFARGPAVGRPLGRHYW